MGSDGVEELPVVPGLGGEVVAVVDLVSVEVLVLQRLEGAFADAVLAGALVAGADMDQLRVLADEAGEAAGPEAAAVIGHDGDGTDLACLWVGQMLEQRAAEQPLGLLECDLDGGDGVVWFWVGLTCQPSSYFDQ